MGAILQTEQIQSLTGLSVYERSPEGLAGGTVFLAKTLEGKRLGILAAADSKALGLFAGETSDAGSLKLRLAELNHENAAALRAGVPWLQPRPLGLQTSAGTGDRLGLATPGHVQAAESAMNQTGKSLGMIYAQQSIREMTRTWRSADNVMDDATFGIFQEGYRKGVGADADHLKNTVDIDNCIAAGFTFYTIDPGEHVDSSADTADAATLATKFAALPWESLQCTAAELRSLYLNRSFDLESTRLSLDELALLRAAVKYGRAVAHTAAMYRHLVGRLGEPAVDGKGGQWELEVSVDETETPTTHAEHYFIASELKRLGVKWVSLAPRYVGRFEKGVDYIGDLDIFEKDFAIHAEIARALGPYKLSLHSGSDKFSVYAICARHTRGLVHLKTAGTSYLEALRTMASVDRPLLREILGFAIERYETDKASYHVSAVLSKVPRPDQVSDGQLADLFDQFDAREVLHVTFGSVLTSPLGYGARLKASLAANEDAYAAILVKHFLRHLLPLL
jgi:tagaturonate epimerase